MGTNYYLHGPACQHCGRGDDRLHIGKASVGWCFKLHVYHDGGEWCGLPRPKNLAAWRAGFFWKEAFEIRDEYRREVSPDKMIKIITERHLDRAPMGTGAPPHGSHTWEHFFARNYAEPGPDGLLRFCVGQVGCVGHGDGTWDCIEGDFS